MTREAIGRMLCAFASLPRVHKTVIHLLVISFITYNLIHEGPGVSDMGWVFLSLISEVPDKRKPSKGKGKGKRRT